MSDLVADSSAILAFTNREPGGEIVEDALPRSVVSTVNLTEIVSRLIDLGGRYPDVRAHITALPCVVYPFDVDLAFEAGALRESTRHLGISLGDRACLALARRLSVPAMTADRRWADLDIGVDIQLIRQ